MDDSARAPQASDAVLDIASFYPYGYGGRAMYAVRAPFAALDAGEALVGRVARIEGKLYRILSVLRQIGGPVAAGEPIGVEVSPEAPSPFRQ